MVGVHAWFEFYRLRFTFRAVHEIAFPIGKAGNVLRGGFGLVLRTVACERECAEGACAEHGRCAYARLFEPVRTIPGPSGFSDPARPFVFRASHLDGRRFLPGESFHFDLHVFETRQPALEVLHMTFSQLAREGFGGTRGRAELIAAEQLDLVGHAQADARERRAPLRVSLQADAEPVSRLAVDFMTPTELKSRDVLIAEPRFSVLLARARDRVTTLRALNGAAPLNIDYKALGERARDVAMTRCDLRQVAISRTSSRTGQTHPLGGFVGTAEYGGDLREFVPWLSAARFTGVGRQTAWGKGEIQLRVPA